QLHRLLQRGDHPPHRAAVAGGRSRQAARARLADPDPPRERGLPSHHGLAHRPLPTAPEGEGPAHSQPRLQLLPAAGHLAGSVGARAMAKRRVVVTGASGYVAQRMLPPLAERWDLVLLDVRETTSDGGKVPGLVVTDLTQRDRNAYRHHFRGAGAVIHGGYVAPPGLDATTWQDNSDAKFWAEHENVALAYNVCRTALEEGVRRVVVASSNHAADYYERMVWAGRLDMVTPEMPPRSDNWYGWSKAAYELLGFVFATGKVGERALEVVQWRIGGPRDDDIDHVKPGDVPGTHRPLRAHLPSAPPATRV